MTRTSAVELPGCPAGVRAICCDSLGFVKVVEPKLDKGAERGPLDVIARWGQPGLDLGIVAMSYQATSKAMAVGRRSGMVEVLSAQDGSVVFQAAPPSGTGNADGGEAFCGVYLFREDAGREKSVLSCRENGTVALQKLEADVVERWPVCKSGNILTMDVHGLQCYTVFGGKGVEANVWDLEAKSKIWEAKKPKPDKLLLVPPAWVTASIFLSRERHDRVAAGTGDHQVRIYDIRAQRRHVLSFDYGESPIKSLAADTDGFGLYVGTGSGGLGLFDTRTGKLVSGFKGKMAGSVRSIARHPSLPLIASCGLDRFLRVHDLTTRQLLAKAYLKQPLVAVAFEQDVTETREAGDQRVEGVDEDELALRKSKSKKSKKKKAAAVEAGAESPPKRMKKSKNEKMQEEQTTTKKRKKPQERSSGAGEADGDATRQTSGKKMKMRMKRAKEMMSQEDGNAVEADSEQRSATKKMKKNAAIEAGKKTTTTKKKMQKRGRQGDQLDKNEEGSPPKKHRQQQEA